MMIRIFVFLSFFVLSLFSSYENELANFDKNFISAKTDTQIKLHQQLKALYIQSVINDDDKSKVEILKRLIISSKALNLDDKSYADELEESGVSQENINALRKAFIKDSLKESTNLRQDKTPQKIAIQNENINFTSKNVEKTTPKDKTLNSSSSKNAEKISFNDEKTQIRVIGLSKLNNGITLRLDRNLSEKEVKSFILDEKGNFRFISDFPGILIGGKKEFKFETYRLVISQFNTQTIRMVAYAREKIPIKLSFDKENLSIFQENLKNVQNTATKPKIKSEKNTVKATKKEVKNDKLEKEAKAEKESKKELEQSKEPLYILSVKKEEDGVVLKLSDELEEKDIKLTSIKDGKFFRQILSFNAVLEGGRKNFSFNQNSIIIAQYSPKLVRVVLSSTKDFKLIKEFEDDELSLSFSKSTQKVAKTKASQSKKAGKLIVIDPGHGGKDSGALGKSGNLKEKDIVLSTALKLGNELKKRGYKVLYTRNSDKFINLRDRTKFANDKNAALFISIHANAAANASKIKTSEGVETFFLSPARSERSKKAAEKENQGDFEEINYFSKQSILNFLNREKIVASNKLAIDVQKNILNQTRKKYKVVDGGVREAPFWVLVGALMPAILVEIGYITHPSESKKISSKDFQNSLVLGIADGVENYFYNNPQ